jgi:hypothetical protein
MWLVTAIVPLVAWLLCDAARAQQTGLNGWQLVYEDSFEKTRPMQPDGVMGDWMALWGEGSIRDGALTGPVTVCLNKQIPGNQRVEYDARSAKPNCYVGAELCSSSPAGSTYEKCYFGFRVQGKDSRMFVRGKRVYQGPTYEPNRTYHVICQVEDYQVTLWVDGAKVFDQAYTPMLREGARPYILLDASDGGIIDNVKVYTKPAGAAGKERAQKMEAETWRNDLDYTPSTEFVTPHVPYAKPYAQGPVRALIAAWACAGRSAVELHERMDLELDYASEGPNNLHWRGNPLSTYPGPAGGERMAALLRNPHDVIVLGAVPFSYYPRFVQVEILRQVSEGTGLVLSHDQMPTVKDGKLFDLFKSAAAAPPGYFPDGRAQVTMLGKGRIAFVHLTDNARDDDFFKFFTGYSERSVEGFARTVLWAARKEPKVSLAMSFPAGHIERDALAGKPAQVRLVGADKDLPAKLILTVRQDLEAQYPFLYGTMYYQFRPYASWNDVARVESALRPATVPHDVSLQLPPLPAGKYSFDLRAEDPQGRVVAWRNVPVEVTSATRLDDIRIGKSPDHLFKASEELAPVCFSSTDVLHAQVRATGPAGREVRLTLTDRDGRVVATAGKPLPPGEPRTVVLALPLSAAYHRLLIATAELLDGQRAVSELRAPVGIAPHPERIPAFQMRLYGCSQLRPDLMAAGMSYRIGYRLSLPESLLCHSWHDMSLGDWRGVLPPADKIVDGVREPSYSDPAFRKKKLDELRAYLQPAAAFGLKVFLCDEWAYAYVKDQRVLWPESALQDTSEPAKRDYREYLAAEYGNIAALNTEWGTNHQAFSQINPPVYDKNPAKAPPDAMWPQIVDHRTFVEKNVADYIKEVADVARDVSPLNQIGTSAHYDVGMWTGRDDFLWAKNGPHIVTYRNHVLWQSFTEDKVGWWMGYGEELRDPARESTRAWEALFTGIEQAYWGREEPQFLPDFALNKAPAQYFAAMREIRDTAIGDLLMSCAEGNMIGILYNPKSAVIANLQAWQAGVSPTVSNRDTDFLGKDVEALLPMGAYHYVHTSQVIADSYGRYARPTLIWLPRTEVLSEAEAAGLRRFVEAGGVLVADMNPGARDGHGRLAEKGMLDDVFGIRRTGNSMPPAKGDWTVKVADGAEVKAQLIGATPIEGTTAKAQATVLSGNKTSPAFLVNHLGKGKAICLNFLPSNAAAARPVLAAAGLPEQAKLDAPASAIRMVRRFARGGHAYYGCVSQLKEDQAPITATLALDQPRHVYDAKRKKYLGCISKVPLTFGYPFEQVQILACLPYQVDGVVVSGVQPGYAPGTAVNYEIAVRAAGAQAGIHTVRVRVYDPDGHERRIYAQSLQTQDGSAKGEFRLARNDAAGKWKITACDIATGVESVAAFDVGVERP